MQKPVNHYRIDPAALAPIVAYVRSQPYEDVVGLLDTLQAGITPVHHEPIDPEQEPTADTDETGKPENPTT